MEQIKFSSVDELFNRLKPAFNTKIGELKAKNIKYIEVKDIWDYLSRTKWSRETNLELCDMVSDILNVNENDLLNFININK
ncbi:MAG: hypothetical protein J5634_03555 [Bacilli bacterium]|nr:hypothetical protein [Bacilli bacterium]